MFCLHIVVKETRKEKSMVGPIVIKEDSEGDRRLNVGGQFIVGQNDYHGPKSRAKLNIYFKNVVKLCVNAFNIQRQILKTFITIM